MRGGLGRAHLNLREKTRLEWPALVRPYLFARPAPPRPAPNQPRPESAPNLRKAGTRLDRRRRGAAAAAAATAA